MNRYLGIAALVLSLAALVISIFRGPSGEVSADSEEALAGEFTQESSGARGDLESKVASLEWTVASLVGRVKELESRRGSHEGGAPGSASPALSESEQKQLEVLRGHVDSLLTGEPLETEKGRERLKELVRQAQDEVFAERVQERSRAREEQQKERLKRFVQEARLSSSQEQQLVQLLEQESQKQRALAEQRGAGQGPRELFRARLELRTQTDEAVKRVLGGDQIPLYEQMRSEDRGRGRGFPGMDGPRGGGRQP